MAQYNKSTQDFQNNGRTLFEANMLADYNGNVAHPTTPIPVSIHSAPFGGADVTSKNRLKVSTYEIEFSSTFQFGKETDVWDEELTTGGTAVHNPNTNMVDMDITTDIGSKVIRQTRTTQRYTPGKPSIYTSSLILGGNEAGYRKRVGLFDEENGFFFEIVDGQYNVVVRSSTSGSVVENRVARENWNGDKLDGTGPSGYTADVEVQQLISFEYEWYGAGQIKVGFTIRGVTHYIHTFNHANIIILPWSSTPFLPMRFELENLTGGQGNTSFLSQGSSSISTEGQSIKYGTPESYMTPLVGTTLTTARTFYPVLSLRLKSGSEKGIILPASFQVATIDNTNLFYHILRNPVLTGGAWVDHPDPDSFTQVHTYPGGTSTAHTGGVIVASGIIVGDSSLVVRFEEHATYQIGRSSMGTVSDVFTIAVASSGANKSAVAAMTWMEQR
jgi:hypothetical protein